jgi:hypothetical protein
MLVGAIGRIGTLRAYCNFSGKASWNSFVRRSWSVARQMQNLSSGKKGTDIALGIDTVEVPLTKRVDVFVLILSD